jgi:hypothetical protein
MGTVYSLDPFVAEAVDGILKTGNVDIIGIDEAIAHAATVAMLTIRGKKIYVERIYMAKINVKKYDCIAIGIDLRKKEDGSDKDPNIEDKLPPIPYIGISTKIPAEVSITKACDLLYSKGHVDIVGSGTTMSKVVYVTLTVPDLSRIKTGIEHIKLGTCSSREEGKSTMLQTRLSTSAAEKQSLKAMCDFFAPHLKDIEHRYQLK